MTEADNRLLSVLKDLDDNLCCVKFNANVDRSATKASHALHWLNEHIEHNALFDFIDKFGDDLEYQETIKILLNKSLFKTKWKLIH